jgi:hypothetical protein
VLKILVKQSTHCNIDKTFELLSYVAQYPSSSAGPLSRQAMGLDANFFSQLLITSRSVDRIDFYRSITTVHDSDMSILIL